MTEDLNRFDFSFLIGERKRISKWFYPIAKLLSRTDKITTRNYKLLQEELDMLSLRITSYLTHGGKIEKSNCLFKIYTVQGLLKFYYFLNERLDENLKKQCFDLLFEAKENALISKSKEQVVYRRKI